MDDQIKARINAAVKEAGGYQAWHEDVPPHLAELIRIRDPAWMPDDRKVLDPEIRKVQRQIDWVNRKYCTFKTRRERAEIYDYLTAVFDMVAFWAKIGRCGKFITACLKLAKPSIQLRREPFGVAIFATAEGEDLDPKTRSKWSRALRYVALGKRPPESVRGFMTRLGGVNECASRFTARLRRDAWRRKLKGPLRFKRRSAGR